MNSAALMSCLPALKNVQKRAQTLFNNLQQEYPAIAQWLADHQQDFMKVTIGSDFVVEQIQRHPEDFIALAQDGALYQSYSDQALYQTLQAQLQDCINEAQLNMRLRRFRNREQLRIIWRELLRLCELPEICTDLSNLAQSCTDLALNWLYKDTCKQYGTPIGKDSDTPQQLIVLAMGKLGAGELNLSSDIDLIFGYPEDGATDREKRPLANQEFFTRLGQRLIKALDSRTADGFVFRTDMRLRPYGDGAALVFSIPALLRYYQEQGRDWERYAMIKAGALAGDRQAGQQLLEQLKPFVYRRYQDFSMMHALRDMKRSIQKQVLSRSMEDNIKLGAGGIREVEFIAQVLQLIHGGRDLSLQQPRLMEVLDTLSAHQYLTEDTVEQLRHGYLFLRRVEHALQACQDQQTQRLPHDEQGQARLAFNMGYADWDSLQQELDKQRGVIDSHFQELVADPNEQPDNDSQQTDHQWIELWSGRRDRQKIIERLKNAGFRKPDAVADGLAKLRNSSQLRHMQDVASERMVAFIPKLLQQTLESPDPDQVVALLLPLLEAVARRSAYLVLLMENPEALRTLVKLCSASPWIAEQVTHFPFLLDNLLNEERLLNPPQAKELTAQLKDQLKPIPEDDLEQQMETLRHFKLSHSFRVAASEISGALPLMKASDYLTWLAESILEQVLELAWRHLTARHGFPRRKDGARCDMDFLIVGYGKLGGIEMGYGSDLDLVFIHNADPSAETDGERPIDGAQFYTRLGQRIIHLLTTHTLSGPLYPVDLRLRPSGSAGLLVTSLAAYKRYQLQEAWTWEHQALVRARPIAGSQSITSAFRQLRNEVLSQPRDLDDLRRQVAKMRDKMRSQLGTKKSSSEQPGQALQEGRPFDLKQDAGGIVDIEFMVQYAVLAWAHQCPTLLEYTDNIRILDALHSEGLLSAEDVELLQVAYKTYRAEQHRHLLQNRPRNRANSAFIEQRKAVMAVWQRLGLQTTT